MMMVVVFAQDKGVGGNGGSIHKYSGGSGVNDNDGGGGGNNDNYTGGDGNNDVVSFYLYYSSISNLIV